MTSPYGLDIIDNCNSCELRANRLFCDLSESALQTLNEIKNPAIFPKGAVLLVEGQSPRGVFMLCSGKAKLSVCSGGARLLITHIAEPGEILGLSAAILGKPYEVTAETLEPCLVNFIRRDDFLRFLAGHTDASLRVIEQLSQNYYVAHEQVRLLGLSNSAAARLAKLIIECCARYGKETERGISLKLTLTHEEIAQLIGVARETVTRLFSEFKSEQIIQVNGATLLVRDKGALEEMVMN